MRKKSKATEIRELLDILREMAGSGWTAFISGGKMIRLSPPSPHSNRCYDPIRAVLVFRTGEYNVGGTFDDIYYKISAQLGVSPIVAIEFALAADRGRFRIPRSRSLTDCTLLIYTYRCTSMLRNKIFEIFSLELAGDYSLKREATP